MAVEKKRYCPECFREFADNDGIEVCPEHRVPLIALPGQACLDGMVIDNKYRIEGRIGQGGMGTVYRATQKYIEREVALKILRAEFASDVLSVKRFFVEARAASLLRSKNSVVLYDFGLSEDGYLYYTMELVNGQSLGRILRSSGPLPLARAIKISTDICQSLCEAHSHGIIHRDLKPDNVMVVGGGQGETAKVVDFGIAKLLTGPEGTGLTKTGMICGTPEYMSPEQALGTEVGPESDVYSLGIVFYEMLAGFPPFKAGTPMQVLLKQINETPRPIAAVKPEVAIPLEVEALLTRMLAKNPKERPGDTGKLRDELDALRPSPTTRGKTVLMPEMVTTSTGTRQITDRFSENDKTPSPDDRTPSPDDRTPSPDDRTPSPDDRTPSPDDRTPSPDDRTPSPDDRTPSPDEVIASPRAVALPKADTPGPASPVVSPAPPDDDPDPYAEVFSHSASKPRLGSRDRGGIDREETTRTGRRRRGPFPRPAKVQAEPADFSADYSAWNRSRRLGLALLAGVALLALIGAYLLFYFDA